MNEGRGIALSYISFGSRVARGPSMDERERGEDRRDGRIERGGNGNKFVNAMDDHRHNDCV